MTALFHALLLSLSVRPLVLHRPESTRLSTTPLTTLGNDASAAFFKQQSRHSKKCSRHHPSLGNAYALILD